MKIMLVNSLYYPDEPGGAERVVRIFARALVRQGIDVVVVCLTRSNRRQEDLIDGIRVIRLPLANLYWPFDANTAPPALMRLGWHLADDWNSIMARRLAKTILREQPDLVELHNLAGFSSAAIAAARRCGVPVVQTLHDFYYACPKTAMLRNGLNCTGHCGDCRLLTSARRRASQDVDLVIGVSQSLLDRLENAGVFRGVPKEVVWNPCDPDIVVAKQQPRPLHGPSAPLRLGFLGRLNPTKGLENLLDAVRLLPDLPVSAAVAGRGEPSFEAALRARASGLPVEFLGHISPDQLFGQIDFLVVPSIWQEPFGLVVQEALSHRVPVIGANIGGIPEVLGQACSELLFDPGDAFDLAAVIRGLVLDGVDLEAWAEICHRRSLDFAIGPIVEKKLTLFEQLVGGRPPINVSRQPAALSQH